MASPFSALRLIRSADAVTDELVSQGHVTEPIRHVPGTPRTRGPITAAAATIDVSDSAAVTSAVSRYARTWQKAAWDYFEAIGEVRYGFSSLAAAAGRAILLAAIQEDPTKPPITLTAIKDSDPFYDKVGGKTRQCMERGNEIMAELGRQWLTSAVLNIEVAGEFFLTRMDGQWIVLSSEELVPMGINGEVLTEAQIKQKNGPKIVNWAVKRDRGRPPIPLDANAYLARIWKQHPRWQQEPSSSMIGVLDQCEALLLMDQMVRSTTRSRLFAGALFVPDDVSSLGEDSLESDLTTAALTAVTQENAAFGVVPLILQGPAEAGDQIKHIMLSRGIDEPTVMLIERTLDRILTGIDLPKEFVKGLGSAKYANAVVLEEGMYRSHIAPILELISDALTRVYLRPRLLKEGFNPKMVERMVVSFDPANIVNRPDAGQAANDGFDRKVLSAAAWRTARGFSEADAPTSDEQYQRWMREKGVIPPDAAAAYTEFLGGNGLRAARKYVEKINAAAQAANPAEQAADGEQGGSDQGGPGSGANQTTGPQVQAPTEPTAPSASLPPELSEILGPQAQTAPAPRDRSTVPGSDRRPGEMLPPRP